MAKTKPKRTLFARPLGDSARLWNNLHSGTDGGETCGLCGTEFKEGESVTRGRFLGIDFVEDCCGKVFDVLYEEIGEEFAIAFLEDFAKDPGAERFYVLRRTLLRVFEIAAKNLAESHGQVDSLLGSAEALNLRIDGL